MKEMQIQQNFPVDIAVCRHWTYAAADVEYQGEFSFYSLLWIPRPFTTEAPKL